MMINKHTELKLVLVLLLSFVIVGSQAQADKPDKSGGSNSPPYRLTELTPPGYSVSSSWTTDLNDPGVVAGGFVSGGHTHAFLYDSVVGTWLTFADGIEIRGLSNNGRMVGYDEFLGEALLWDSATDPTPQVLVPLTGYDWAVAVDINNAGIVIGECFDTSGDRVAVAWFVNAAGEVSLPVELPSPVGDPVARVFDLNEPDALGVAQIVGASGQGNPLDLAIRWEVTVNDSGPVVVSGPTDLGSLRGAETVAYGINSAGDIVGKSGNWPFLKPDGQLMQTLVGIRKATYGSASDINHLGQMVGQQGYVAQGRLISKAVLWTSADSAIELDKLVELGRNETLEGASRINGDGLIAGSGYFPGTSQNENIGFLLVPNQ